MSFLLPDGADPSVDVPSDVCGMLLYGAGLAVVLGPSRADVLDYAGVLLLAWCREVKRPCSITASIREHAPRRICSDDNPQSYEALTIVIDKGNVMFLPTVKAPPLAPEHPPPQTVPAPG